MAKQGRKQCRLSLSLLLRVCLLLCGVICAVAEESVGIKQVTGGQGSWPASILHDPSACNPNSPVCAEGNVTYKSECLALANGASIVATGACDVENKTLVPCSVNCFRANPVCGTNKVTYWCGTEEAKCAGVEVAHNGYCDIWEGGTDIGSTAALHAAQSLQLVHMLWLVVAGLLIVLGLP